MRATDTPKCSTETVRVVLFDQSPLFRAGIAHVLKTEPRFDLIAALDTFETSLTVACDVVIIDAEMMMVALSGDRSHQVLRLRAKVLVLASRLDEEDLLAAFAAGAHGYLPKAATEEELLRAIHAVHNGEGYVPPGVAATMLRRSRGPRHEIGCKTNVLDQLSHREGEIFKLLLVGLTNKEIGHRLQVTENTIKRYFTRIFDKLHVRNRVEAAMLSRTEPKAEVPSERRNALWIPPLHVALPVAPVTPKLSQSPGPELVAVALGGAK